MTEVYNATESFVTGQQVSVRLLVEVKNETIPVILNWDSAEITTKFKGKKNHGIGMPFVRNQNTIEDYEITLTRAKQDSAIEAVLTTLQRNQKGRMYHTEYVIEIEINHNYFISEMKPPSNAFDEFSTFVQKAGQSILKNATIQATAELRSLANQGLNTAKNAAANYVNKQLEKPQNKRLVNGYNNLKNTVVLGNVAKVVQNTLTPPVQEGLALAEKTIRETINKNIDLNNVISAFGIKQPDTFREVYHYIFAVVNDAKTGHQPKDISKESIVFNASIKLVKTEKDILHDYVNTTTIAALTQSQLNQTDAENQNYGQNVAPIEIRSVVKNPNGIGTTTFITQDDSVSSVRIKTNQNVAKKLGTTLSNDFDKDFAETKALMNQIFDTFAPGVKGN